MHAKEIALYIYNLLILDHIFFMLNLLKTSSFFRPLKTKKTWLPNNHKCMIQYSTYNEEDGPVCYKLLLNKTIDAWITFAPGAIRFFRPRSWLQATAHVLTLYICMVLSIFLLLATHRGKAVWSLHRNHTEIVQSPYSLHSLLTKIVRSLCGFCKAALRDGACVASVRSR